MNASSSLTASATRIGGKLTDAGDDNGEDNVTVLDIADEQLDHLEQHLGSLHERAFSYLQKAVYVPTSLLDSIYRTENQLTALQSVRLRAAMTTPEEDDDGDGETT